MPFFVVAKIETDQSPLTCPAPRNKSKGTLGTSPQGLSTTTPLASVDEDNVAPAMRHASLSHNRDYPTSPAPSEHGSIRLHSNGANYVGSFHWAAVLDSISELRDHYEEEEEARLLAANDHVLHESPGPRLLYEPVQTTKADLLAAIPAQPAVDRMVARYFNAQGVVPEVLHSGRFLREYENFWKDPNAVSIAWIGLLFSVMSLSTRYQQSIEGSEDPETPVRVHMFRENVIHCLVLCQWTRGGDYVLETLINYLTSELFLSRDSEIGLWLVQGMLVQLALSLGYHRDPQNFSSISPFAGEMRRRVWAVIVQMDLRLSSQMALPRLLKLQQYDTAEPRNLLDTDFDENTTELPESRPETEVTPVLYSLARTRIDQMNGLVSDLVNDTREHPYAEIIDLDRKLQEAEASLSPIFRWQPLSQSFMVLPQIVMHRVLLQLAIQRVTVWLHRKYLTPSYYNPAQFEYSRKACIKSAMRILEFQQIVDEETQKDGLLYPVRWMFTSSRLNAVFLLGISILCYYVQLTRTHPDVSLGEQTDNSINDLLQNVYPLWLRLSAISPGARRVVQLLHPLLGMDGQENDQTPVATPNSVSPFPVSRDMMSLDQPAWEPYEDSIVNFSSMPTFPNSVDFRYSDGLMSSSTTAVVSMADLLLTNTTEFDQWMNGQGRTYESK
ncbi:fungal-specific transcription factor domain protein [Penicillium digitatum]|uniref:Fungal-specific transcription factor domain protein n=1 Tax=Penicillium digitatum TaxID=36651 RepID=A0A7T6XTK8_PENDI|nr:fungal-specific transcription factor domain protein [Penicillium digitatum]